MKRKEPEKASLKFGDKRLYSLIKLPGAIDKKHNQHDTSLSAEETIKRILEELERRRKNK